MDPNERNFGHVDNVMGKFAMSKERTCLLWYHSTVCAAAGGDGPKTLHKRSVAATNKRIDDDHARSLSWQSSRDRALVDVTSQMRLL